MNTRKATLTVFGTAATLLGLALFVPSGGTARAATPQQIAPRQRAAEVAPASSVTTSTVFLPLIERHGWVVAPLVNSGFEAAWDIESSRQALRVNTDDGSIAEIAVDNILTPPGWLTWFSQGQAYDDIDWGQPEVRGAPHTDPNRMHSGALGQLLFTFWRVHDAGFLQHTEVITGQQVRLSGWAHAWSNNGGPPEHPDDPYWSEGSHVGYNHFFATEGTEGLDGGDQNVTFWLGIDPLGGIDPYADTVIWGQGAHIYNSYRQVPAVTATAGGPTVTVFLRSRTLWRFKHNDVYWDDIQLEVFR